MITAASTRIINTSRQNTGGWNNLSWNMKLKSSDAKTPALLYSTALLLLKTFCNVNKY